MTRAEALRILGLQPDATAAEAKRAYRQLVRAVHPDKNSAPSARHLFQLVQEAYEFISAVEPPKQTWENTASDTRGTAERETRTRTAKESANREAKEKAAKEAKTQEERKRQRTSAPTGLWALGGSCVLVFVGLCCVSGILAIVIMASVGAFFGLRVEEGIPFMGLAFLLAPIMASILTRLVHVWLKKHQMRKSHNNQPR